MGIAGIEKIAVYPCTLALPMEDLCRARDYPWSTIRDQMMIDQRSVNPVWEDPVTQAVNAGKLLLSDSDRNDIELLIVATESGVDQEKALSSWAHRYLELKPECRSFEIKQACYGGVAALQMAVAWLNSDRTGDAKALILTTDQSRPHFGQRWEFVLGAGAAAVLVSNRPRLVRVESEFSGYVTREVSDLMRPTSRVETGHSETSMISYLEALEHSFAHYWARAGQPADLDSWFDAYVYHAPFGGMTFRAHRALLRRWKPEMASRAREHFDQKSASALDHVRRMGGTYSSSVFIGLLGLLQGSRPLQAGARIGVFSYGSGCCAEYFSVRVCEGADAVVSHNGLRDELDARRLLSVAEYEVIEKTRADLVDRGDYRIDASFPSSWYETGYQGRKRLVYEGVDEYVRRYRWS